MTPACSGLLVSWGFAGFLIYAYKGAFVGIGAVGFLYLVRHPGRATSIKEVGCKFHCAEGLLGRRCSIFYQLHVNGRHSLHPP